MRISVIGCGYLGAVHAACMAELGHDVVGVDTDEVKVAQLANGVAPFFEPGLQGILTSAIASGRLRFTTDISQIEDAVAHFVAVGTPQAENSHSADLRFVDAAFEAAAPYLRPGAIVVGKSTVPVGTAARLAQRLSTTAPSATLAWNPEFLREGLAVKDTLSPDRLVYGVPSGADGVRAVAILDEVYELALAHDTPRIVSDYATAELVKVSANAFLATKISFINAMAEIAEATGADVTMLADALGHDARIGRRFLNSGLGFGGGCLPKDIRAFQARAEELGLGESLAFLGEVDAINLRRRERMVALTVEHLGDSVEGKRVGVLGLAFKPDSDDVRDSPSLDVSARLHELGAIVTVTDPEALHTAQRYHPELSYVSTVTEAVHDADVVLVLTEWAQYRGLVPSDLAGARGQVLLDGRNCLDPDVWRSAGWTYRSLGRP